VDSARLLVGGDQGLNGRRVLNPVVRMPFSPGRQNRISALRSQRIFPKLNSLSSAAPYSLCTKGWHQYPTV
jgi:hypothetical protein